MRRSLYLGIVDVWQAGMCASNAVHAQAGQGRMACDLGEACFLKHVFDEFGRELTLDGADDTPSDHGGQKTERAVRASPKRMGVPSGMTEGLKESAGASGFHKYRYSIGCQDAVDLFQNTQRIRHQVQETVPHSEVE